MSDMEDISGLPQATLYAVARNESAEPRYRKAAVRLMLERGYQQVNHADLSAILADVKADMGAEAEVSDIVEQAIEAPMPTAVSAHAAALNAIEDGGEEPKAGPFRASFTTKNF